MHLILFCFGMLYITRTPIYLSNIALQLYKWISCCWINCFNTFTMALDFIQVSIFFKKAHKIPAAWSALRIQNKIPVRFPYDIWKTSHPCMAAVSLINNWYWTDWPTSQSPFGCVPYNRIKTRMFSAYSSLPQCSFTRSIETTGCISSVCFPSGLGDFFLPCAENLLLFR